MAANAMPRAGRWTFGIDDDADVLRPVALPRLSMPIASLARSTMVFMAAGLEEQHGGEVLAFKALAARSMQALKYAWMSVQSGWQQRHLRSFRRMSAWMNSSYAFLRVRLRQISHGDQ